MAAHVIEKQFKKSETMLRANRLGCCEISKKRGGADSCGQSFSFQVFLKAECRTVINISYGNCLELLCWELPLARYFPFRRGVVRMELGFFTIAPFSKAVTETAALGGVALAKIC